ncbi:MAG: glycosyltransferase [Gammaproteobacteria bacterium]|nr:glycosyltransferase [Gammaproteobacteria bacterium]
MNEPVQPMKSSVANARELSLARCQAVIDDIFPVGETGLFVVGWIAGTGKQAREIWLGPGTERYDILRYACRYPRPDIVAAKGSDPQLRYEDAGFMVFVPDGALRFQEKRLAVACDGELLYHLEIRKMPAQGMRPLETAKRLLKHVNIHSTRMREWMERQIAPAMATLNLPNSVTVTPEVREYGSAPKQPIASVIAPLYGRLDLMEHQLCEFGLDAQFRAEVELIYVLDDPKLQDSFTRLCHEVAPLYGVPFKTLTYPVNLGYAGANNVGARVARSRHLVLLNSDVFPDQPGWVQALAATHRQLPDCGALGVRLLFPDGSVQHDGMRFERFPFLDHLWINTHPGKGLPVSDAPVAPVALVPAVTAACLWISREDFLVTAGGFDEGYIIGDFEDSDLCLKLLLKGRRNYLTRNIVLYHLERQSQRLAGAEDWRQKVTAYNCWRHTQRWDAVLSRLCGEAA